MSRTPDEHQRPETTGRREPAGTPLRRPACRTNLYCPVCGHEFLPEEVGKKPHCRRCGYLESCCNPE